MPKLSGKSLILLLICLVLLGGLVITLSISKQRQQQRSNAAVATTLSFSPSSSVISPLQQTVGTTTSYDIILNPGSNVLSTIQLEINYDPSKLGPDITTSLFQPNTAFVHLSSQDNSFTQGKITVSLSANNGALTSQARIGTITLKSIGVTSSPTSISFGDQTKVLSASPTSTTEDNVLSSTSPAFISIGNATTPDTTNQVTSNITPAADQTLLGLNLLLQGIGSAGDYANPTASSLSNKSPLHPTRQVSVLLYDKTNTLLKDVLGSVTYNPTAGNFTGTVDLGSTIPTGTYLVKIKTAQYLRKLIPGTVTITPGKITQLPQVSLIGGDSNDDNTLSILDYNILIGCYTQYSPPTACSASQKLAADLNDDGVVSQTDYNFFLREFPAQTGD